MKRISLLLLLASLRVPSAAAGTSASLDYGASWVTPTDGRPALPLQVSPGIAWVRSPLQLAIAGTVFTREGTLRPERGSVRLSYLRPEMGEVVLTAEARRDAPWNRPVMTELRSSARIARAGSRAGGWVGVDGIRIAERNEGRLSFLDIGAWAKHRRLTLTTYFDQSLALLPEAVPQRAQRPDTGSVVVDHGHADAAIITRSVTVTNARLSARWAGDRLELESTAGLSLSSKARPQRWLETVASYWIRPGVAICAKARTHPEDVYRYEAPDRLQTSLFLRLHTLPGMGRSTPGQAESQRIEWSLDRLEGEWAILRVIAPGVGKVEVRSDVTDWQPLALNRMEGNVWETRLQITPGVHSIDLRFNDGPWGPPPGAPVQEDGFLGVVGQVVVP